MAAGYEALEPWYEHLYAVLHEILRTALAPAPAEGRPGGLAPRALDAGCGSGFQATLLRELGYAVHGTDLSGGLLAVARRRLPGAGLVRADLETLPYRAGVFDVVSCCGSTLSFVARPARALAELGRVLRPGGRLLLECEHRWSLDLGWALLSSLAGDPLAYELSAPAAWRLLGPPWRRGCRLAYPGYGTLHLFTRRELEGWLRAAALRPVRWWGIHAATGLIPSTILHRARLPRVLRPLYRLLRAADTQAARRLPGPGLASSAVVLAVRSG